MRSPLGLSVYLNVTNVEKSAAFYEALGFEKAEEYPPPMRVIRYELGKASFLIGPSDATDDAEVRRWLAMKPWGVGVVLMPEVPDVEEVHRAALDIGAEIESPPTLQEWGSKTLQIVDPDGYSIIFDEPVRRTRKRAAARRGAKKGKKRAPARRGKKSRR